MRVMSNVRAGHNRSSTISSLVLCLSLLLLQVSGVAQAQAVLTGSQTGVIQLAEGLSPREIMISGVVYEIDRDITVFTLKGEEISRADLEFGMVVRFTTNGNTLAQVQVLGPNNLIADFESH